MCWDLHAHHILESRSIQVALAIAQGPTACDAFEVCCRDVDVGLEVLPVRQARHSFGHHAAMCDVKASCCVARNLPSKVDRT